MSLRRLLSPLKPLVRGIRSGKAAAAVLSVAVRSRWAAGLYCLLGGQWDREQRAVLHGRLAHLRGSAGDDDAPLRFALQRNTHRLEKGLIMRPRRDVFARDYILETVRLYAGLADRTPAGAPGAELLAYSHDVLKEYFAVAGSDPVVDRARAEFEKAPPPPCRTIGARVPHPPETSPLPVGYDELMQLALRRRSVRWYLQKPVPREVIDRAIAVAALSPSACNRQPFEFRIFDDPDLVRQVASIPAGTRGFEHNFPCIVALVGKQRAFLLERDRHVIYIDSALAAMAFLFALQVQGVSSCCINWPDIPDLERKMARTLGLAPDERVTMLISLGYADPEGLVPFSQKKTLDELRSYNRT
ncbi:MAG: nitroreductase family protein [Armatimonadota bacterium]